MVGSFRGRRIDHNCFKSNLLDLGDQVRCRCQLRIKRHIESIILKVDFDILDTSKPIQGFFDRVGSTHSGNAGRFDEPGNAQGHRVEL